MKYFTLLLCLLSLNYINAQDTKQREIGITLNNLNFGAVYRIGTENKLWRFSAVYGSGENYSETEYYDSVNYKRIRNSFGLSIGKEKRKSISDDLALRMGVDIPANFGYFNRNLDDISVNNSNDYNYKEISYGLGLRFVLGLNYSIGENFLVGLEVLPGVSYNFGKKITTDMVFEWQSNTYEEEIIESNFSSLSYGFSSGSALLTLVYKF